MFNFGKKRKYLIKGVFRPLTYFISTISNKEGKLKIKNRGKLKGQQEFQQ